MWTLEKANSYLSNHIQSKTWETLIDDVIRNEALKKGEMYLNSFFNFREGTEDTLNYEHAVYEQTIFLLDYDKERFKLQSEGVTSIGYDGISYQMNRSLISPSAFLFLRKHVVRKKGRIL